MTRFARNERQGLCDTFELVGPDAPTLCEGWAAKDLAAHLVIRDSRPDLAAGMFVPALAPRLDAAMRRTADTPWSALVQRVRQGPPKASPMRIGAVDEAVNLVEFFIHHEDVLRAGSARRRELGTGLQTVLWTSLRRMGRSMFRKAATGVVLVAEGHGRCAAKSPTARGTVIVRGAPSELVLLGYGRGDVADVELTGDPDDVAALRSSRLGLA